MNHSHKSSSSAKVRTGQYLWAALVAIASLFSLSPPSAIAQQAAPQRTAGATIQGRVIDPAGKPAGDVTVRLNQAGAHPAETKTNAAGAFEFSALPTGTYTLTAETSGTRSAPTAIAVESNVDRKHVDLLLESTRADHPSPAPAQPMGFSDAPNFTVAGVTDWTAVGGHGSDSILRTSEDLARETLALKAKNAEPGAADPAGRVTKTSQSESSLRAALAGAPGTFAANHQLGEYYLRAGRYRESLPLLEAAYRLDPANEGNERDLAAAYEGTGDLKQARAHIASLLKLRNDADLHRTAGDLDEKLRNPLSAVQEYQQAVSLDPSEQNYFAWGSELLLHRAVWQAAEVFRTGVKAHPQSARLHTALGTALFAGALYEDAARSLCTASDLDPANSDPYIFMGKVAMAAPAPLSCVEAKLARFAQKNPDSSLANYLYAMAIWKQQQSSSGNPDLQQVETLLTKAVSIDSRCSEGYLQLGKLAASQRDFERAIQLYKKAIEVDPKLAEAHYRLGVSYDRLGARDKAQQEFALHDQIEKRQAADVERERQDIKQFVVVPGQPANPAIQ